MNIFLRRQLWLCLAACSLFSAVAAYAGDTSQAEADSCIEVVVDGQRALPLDCYTRMMTPEPQKTHPTHNPAFDSADVAKRQPNAIGQFSQSALRNRMGNNLGHSAKPQRPPR